MSKVGGWAVRDAFGIDVKTVSETRRAAMVNWLVAGRENLRPVMISQAHTDADIERLWAGRFLKAGITAYLIQVEIREVSGG